MLRDAHTLKIAMLPAVMMTVLVGMLSLLAINISSTISVGPERLSASGNSAETAYLAPSERLPADRAVANPLARVSG